VDHFLRALFSFAFKMTMGQCCEVLYVLGSVGVS
jgi:hypothetical protein